jgi:hypothetical protein
MLQARPACIANAPCPYRYAKALRAWKHCEQAKTPGIE